MLPDLPVILNTCHLYFFKKMIICKHVYCLLFRSEICPLSLDYLFNCPRMSGTIYIAAILLSRFHIKNNGTIIHIVTFMCCINIQRTKTNQPDVSEQRKEERYDISVSILHKSNYICTCFVYRYKTQIPRCDTL